MGKLRRGILNIDTLQKSVELIKGTQSGIWGLFGDMLVVTWTVATNDEALARQVQQEAADISGELPGLTRQLGLPASTKVRQILHEGVLDSQQPMGAQWRTLFAQAVIKLEHAQSDKEIAS